MTGALQQLWQECENRRVIIAAPEAKAKGIPKRRGAPKLEEE